VFILAQLTLPCVCHTIIIDRADMLYYNEKNLKKHNVSPQEARQVLDYRNLSTEIFELPPARNGNERRMFVGLTLQARLLEIGVEELSKSDDYVFHGRNATKQYR
jgi:uncharacterized DUF497 family protein